MGQITPAQLQALLGYASRELGMSPEQLARTVQTGGVDAVTRSVNPDTARRVREIAGDPAQMQEFLKTPQVQQLLAKLLGGEGRHG